MKFDDYQQMAAKYDLEKATTDLTSLDFIEKVLGLVGEAGETADKVKKIIRDKDGVASKDDINSIKKELGDTLWYIASIARYLEIPLSEVAEKNLDKLESRYRRNQLHGEGDER